MLGASTLLEREQALAALHGAHSETKVGHGRLVLVAGEAGIGKTALVRAFCDDVRSSSRVLSGACDALATPRPLGPFVDVSTQTGGKLAAIVDEGGRSHLLERRSRECFVTDQYDEGIAALEQAIESRRSLGDRLREGDDLCRLSEFLCCPGRIAESERAARDAVDVLEDLPPSRELAAAYLNLSFLCTCAARYEEDLAWSRRALALAEQLDDAEIAILAETRLAVRQGREALEQSQIRAWDAGLDDHAGRIFNGLAASAVEDRSHAEASRHLDAGIAYCSERGLEL